MWQTVLARSNSPATTVSASPTTGSVMGSLTARTAQMNLLVVVVSVRLMSGNAGLLQ